MTFLTEVMDVLRFATRDKFARFLGLSPELRSSGKTTRRCGRGLGGNGKLRSLLVEATWVWKRRDSQAGERFRKLNARSAHSAVAIVAMARRLGIMFWRMLKHDRDYVKAPRALAS